MIAKSAIARAFSPPFFAAPSRKSGTARGTASLGWVGGSSLRNPSRI